MFSNMTNIAICHCTSDLSLGVSYRERARGIALCKETGDRVGGGKCLSAY